MSDFVQRLRFNAEAGIPDFTNSKLLDEAADRIEALEAERDDLLKANQLLNIMDPSVDANRIEMQALRAANAELRRTTARIEALEARVKILEDTLWTVKDLAPPLRGRTNAELEARVKILEDALWTIEDPSNQLTQRQIDEIARAALQKQDK